LRGGGGAFGWVAGPKSHRESGKKKIGKESMKMARDARSRWPNKMGNFQTKREGKLQAHRGKGEH